MRFTLDAHMQRDPRIMSVYRHAKRRYAETNRCHHNFPHVMRDLYRALMIAEDEGAVNYSVLIPSVLLHDIGFCDPAFARVGHDVAGAKLAERLLSDLGYERESIAAISHCIRAHKGKSERPRSVEAKILHDADVLEKAGLFGLILPGLLICEFHETLDQCLRRECEDRGAELARGFYTRKAQEIDGGRLSRTRDLLEELRNEVAQERTDYGIREEDLWAVRPPEE